jgi:hypothetical protein
MSCIPVRYCRHIVRIQITSSPGRRSSIGAAGPPIDGRAADCSGLAFRRWAAPGWWSSGGLLWVNGLATSGRWDLGRRSGDVNKVSLEQKVERHLGGSSCSLASGSGRRQLDLASGKCLTCVAYSRGCGGKFSINNSKVQNQFECGRALISYGTFQFVTIWNGTE